MYFYIEGSIGQVQVIEFLTGLLVNCFILSAIYHKTKSLWLCVMTHALINVFSQVAVGGNSFVLLCCRGVIVMAAVFISSKECGNVLKESDSSSCVVIKNRE